MRFIRSITTGDTTPRRFMPAPSANDIPLQQLEAHLAAQVQNENRRTTFDMDDGPETQVLTPFPSLQAALDWLAGKVTEPWRVADQQALQSQSRHRLLARISIGAGTAAIVLAVLQLALKQSWPQWTGVAAILEALAAGAGVLAVVVGLTAKFDRQWLGQRHFAERLRMLKFRSLGQTQLWCTDTIGWQTWVDGELKILQGITEFDQVKSWSTLGEIEPLIPSPLGCAPDPAFVDALTVYYRFKRLEFQAAYFRSRRAEYQRQTGGWRHLSLPLFFASVLCVVAHFGAELHARQLQEAGALPGAESWEVVAVLCVAAAAIIPVLGAGVRAWFAAFELPRSASLFAAKHQALVHASSQVQQDAGNVAATLRHIAQDEHFLEHEHREWLRLLLETEWFL